MHLARSFRVPILVTLGIVIYLVLGVFKLPFLAIPLIFATIILGSYELLFDTFHSLQKKQFALDYIAILAIAVGLITGEYLVAAIIALMISSGTTLEEYGIAQAKKSLTKLVDRIPQDVLLYQNGQTEKKVKISEVKIGQEIVIRKGEVIPLDGILNSEVGITDESSLTGEPYMIDKFRGDVIRSGTVNMGPPIVLRITKAEKDSTYRKIVEMVKNAQGEKAPLIRLADRYSTFFTIITLIIATFAYFHLGGMDGALAVLVIATPCPLIIATPIALMGGVNAAAKKRIIVKKLASLESLSQIDTIVFDKTGTITLGKPLLDKILLIDKTYSEREVLSIAESIERNSLHPIAKALVLGAREKKVSSFIAENVEEVIGSGITGTVKGKKYTLKKLEGLQVSGMTIEMHEDKNIVAQFHFADEIKRESKEILAALRTDGFSLLILTGDRKQSAEQTVKEIGRHVLLKADLSPEDKKNEIARLQKEGKKIAMVGDGINDAPALALADVGLVFSNEEQTIASEAADVVLLGGDFSLVQQAYVIAKNTIHIALQSIRWGIGISIVGMVLASLGLIPPLFGAALQETIDVAVIINALRASRI